MRTRTALSREELEQQYEQWADEYLARLPMEHFMESTLQSRQREIASASLALIKARRPGFHYFNELLIQKKRRQRRKASQVVPDVMIVLSDQEIQARGSYALELQPAPPFCVMEFVSQGNKRKDYEDSYDKYEKELKVPYYLLFNPDEQELILFRHNGTRYVSTPPNDADRFPIPEIDLEIGLVDGWLRFWYRGELLPLPAELQDRLDDERRRADEEKRRADDEKRRADDLQRRLAAAEEELNRLRGAKGNGGKKGKS